MNQRFAIVAKSTNRFLLPVNNRCWTWGVLPNLVLNNGISKWSCTLCISAYYTPGPHRTKKKQPRWHRSFRTTKKISLLARTCKNSARNRKSHGSFQDSKQLETFLWGGLHLTLKYPNPKYLHGFYMILWSHELTHHLADIISSIWNLTYRLEKEGWVNLVKTPSNETRVLGWFGLLNVCTWSNLWASLLHETFLHVIDLNASFKSNWQVNRYVTG